VRGELGFKLGFPSLKTRAKELLGRETSLSQEGLGLGHDHITGVCGSGEGEV
jgi:hypothetical protein